MGRKRIKQYLTLLMALGVIAIVASGSGTFASFNAQVTNPNNTFASGTLFLHNTHGATTCASESANSTNSGMNVISGTGSNGTDVCATLFPSVTLTAGTPSTATLALANAGTIPASNIKFEVNNCGVTTNPATGSGITFGTAPTCANFFITVQETQADFTTNVFCAYGPGTLATACAAPDNTKTLGNSTSFTSLKTTSTVDATLTAAGGAQDTRYYVITVQPGLTNDNSLQNRKLTFDLDWQINSA